jgi:recombination protein RecT
MRGLSTEIAAVLPRHLDPETMTRVVLLEGSRNPDLRRCSSESLAGSIMLASQLGLVPSSPLGHFYLVPRREHDRATRSKVWRCGFVIGYRGFVELARRAGLRVNAGVVFDGELEGGSFRWTVEPPSLQHDGQIGVDRNDEALRLAYAVAERRTASGEVQRWQLVLERSEIEQARRQAQTDKVWSAHFAAMARKTAIRRLLNGGLVPLNAELESALQAENEQERLEVLDAEQLDEVLEAEGEVAPVDPLRVALGLQADQVDQVDAEPDADDLVERALELEGLLDSEQIHEAVAAAGLEVEADGDLADRPVAELERYVRELEARSS